MTQVVLGLGSNRDFRGLNPVRLLRAAYDFLSETLNEIVCSSVYRTKALYVTDQADFYNMAVTGRVADAVVPSALLAEIHRIEAALGRNRAEEIRFGPRTIDIDIELFGCQHVSEPDLEIPHPRLCERAFILIPLLEISENSADCIEREKYAAALKKIPEQGVELYMSASRFLYSPEVADGTAHTG
ncbi:MAG: 2-amino-4-hydroxy-6-hydroxymethyldihydropteridine diphosphokinase [Treponema sp.]|nr:2-amino-4-hydroxy-6-hydroxymethyldihydropteridine diphosphokinase [Treponema sp.]